MYNYLLNVTASNKNATFNDEIIEAIKDACAEANSSTNSNRYGRNFSFVSKLDNRTIQLRLKSDTPIIATRTISSITRALLRICSHEKLEPLKYNGSLLAATVVEEYEEGAEMYNNLQPHEIVQTVIEIFFGQASLGNKDTQIAKDSAKKIKEIVTNYKASTQNH